jgi:5-hydroxyisourate hydrolase
MEDHEAAADEVGVVMSITTHVLDTSLGKPAPAVPVILERQMQGGEWRVIGRGETDADGRLKSLASEIEPGIYRLTFDTGMYFRERHIENFYPEATIVFEVRDAAQHYHVPLLLSPYGYSTYRGS